MSWNDDPDFLRDVSEVFEAFDAEVNGWAQRPGFSGVSATIDIGGIGYFIDGPEEGQDFDEWFEDVLDGIDAEQDEEYDPFDEGIDWLVDERPTYGQTT